MKIPTVIPITLVERIRSLWDLVFNGRDGWLDTAWRLAVLVVYVVAFAVLVALSTASVIAGFILFIIIASVFGEDILGTAEDIIERRFYTLEVTLLG